MAPTKAASAAKATPAAPVKAAEPVKKAAAPVVEAKASGKKAVEKPVEKVVVAETPVAENAEAAATVSLVDKVEAKINSLSVIIKETLAELKVLKKDYEKMRKAVEKTERKRANARTNPNGFAKPTPITDELCHFLNVPVGSVMSRTQTTRAINAYIKEKNLNKPENKRIILPDPALRKLLNVKDGEEISFFSLQKFLSPLFKKNPQPVASA